MLSHPQAEYLLLRDIQQPQRALKQAIEVNAYLRLVCCTRFIAHDDH